MAPYVYDKLDPTRRQIRICLIYPGTLGDPVRCSLRTVSLDDDPQYETLSYAWGAPVLDHTVLVDGAALNVTKNLHNALQYLRRQQRFFSEEDYESSGDGAFKTDVTTSSWDPEASRVLWADAVCINQTDIDERASQVNLMGEVYRHGIRLHVWIGTAEEIRDDIRRNSSKIARDPAILEQLAEHKTSLVDAGITANPTPLASAESIDADADVRGAIEILQLLSKDEHCYNLPFFKVSSINMKLEMDEFWYKSTAMLLGVLNRPWWKRVWVVQEILLSTPDEATLLHISHHQLSLASCDDFSAYQRNHYTTCCHEWRCILLGNYAYADGVKAQGSIESLHRVLRSYKDGSFGLREAYLAFSLREAADPHDYVYGFLGLMEEIPSDLKADYRRSIISLYVAATNAMFRPPHGMMYLELAVGVDVDNQHHLPSWCIDWSEQSDGCDGNVPFNAARAFAQPSQPQCEDDKTLHMETAAEDRITCVNTVIDRMVVDPVGHVVRWMRAIGRRDLEDDIVDVLRVLTRDLRFGGSPGSHWRRVSPQYKETIKAWKDFVSSYKRPPIFTDAEFELGEVDFRIHKQQCLFLTRHGRLGAGPPTTREGDCVFVAKGCQCPLALRPLSDSSFEEGQHNFPSYQFVGLCYVDGIMDGEAVDADTEWQTIRLC